MITPVQQLIQSLAKMECLSIKTNQTKKFEKMISNAIINEKQMIIDAYINCEKQKRERLLKNGFLLIEFWTKVDQAHYTKLAEQYYNETFKQ